MIAISQIQKKITQCPFCDSKHIKPLLELNMPVSLSACEKDKLTELQEFNGLSAMFQLNLCCNCGLGFNGNQLIDEVLDWIYRGYEYIQPQNNIGKSKYGEMITFLKRYIKPEKHTVEVGCASGYLIDKLVEINGGGYTNIRGFEPSKEWQLSKNKHLITNEFYTENTFVEKKVDVFYLMHVLEHFSSPYKMINNMQNNLHEKGKILFEVPNFTGFHHQHLTFFSKEFITSLANKTKMKILEIEETEFVLRVALQNSEQASDFTTINKEKFEKIENLATSRILRYLEAINSLKNFISQNLSKKIYWWGTGSTSIIVLSNLPENMLQQLNIEFLDSDTSRTNLLLPIPALFDKKIKHSIIEINNIKKDDLLIIASSFADEILKLLPKNSISLENIHKVIL